MKLYLISQSEMAGYDTYDSAVVIASDEEDARTIHPDALQNGGRIERIPRGTAHCDVYSWTDDPNKVEVQYLGEAYGFFEIPSVVCASFNAGAAG